MKFIAFFLTFTYFSLAFAASPIAGKLSRTAEKVFIVFENGESREVSKDSSKDALNHLDRLNSGDFIYGQGTITPNNISLSSIDYVGLKKLIGTWLSTDGIFHFKSYNSAAFYFQNKNTTVKSNLQYSTAPAEGNKWVLFLTSENHTTLATIEVHTLNATMRIFHAETGHLLKTIRLTRWDF